MLASKSLCCAPVQAPTSGGRSMISKLRQKANRPKPVLPDLEAAGLMSSALPPGADSPELRARIHDLLREHPEMLAKVEKASDLEYTPMTLADARDLADLQAEWFPEESYPEGEPWCARLLAHEGVVAFKASFPSDPDKLTAGIVVALGTRGAIEEFTEASTVETLRKEITIPRYMPFDAPTRRTLGYVLSVGVVGELRRRGIAAELLRRGLAELRAQEEDLRAVALDLADYNTAAIRCYEAAGFQRLMEQPEAYAGMGRRTHSSLLYALFTEQTGFQPLRSGPFRPLR